MTNSITLRFDNGGTTYFVNNYDKVSLQITKRVSSLEFLSSQSIITQEVFRVPLEGDLVDLIGLVSDLSQNASINLNKKIDGQIIINDLPRFKGSFQVMGIYYDNESRTSEVEFIFKGNEVNVKQELTDITMAELYVGETIPYTMQEIYDFWSNPMAYTPANGIFWPLIDYGQQYTTNRAATSGTILGDITDPASNATALNQTDFKPAVTIKDCFEKMPIDITWDSSIDDLIEQQAILLHNNESTICVLDTSPRDFTGEMHSTASQTATVNGLAVQIAFDTKTFYNQDNFNIAQNRYQPEFSGFYSYEFSGSLDVFNSGAAGSIYYKIEIYNISTGVTINELVSTGGAINAATTETVNFNFRTSDVFVAANGVTSLGVGFRLTPSSLTGTDSIKINTGVEFEVITTPAITTASNILVPENCPDLTAWDIFRSILLQCNGIVEQNAEGVYNIIPWVEWIDSNVTNLFLDSKIDPNIDLRIRPYSIEGAKSIKLTYAKDEDLYNEVWSKKQVGTYGQLEIRDTGTDGTIKELKFELPFASSPPSYIDGSGFQAIKLYNSEGKIIKGKPRILNFNSSYERGNIGFVFEDITGALTQFAPTVQAGTWPLVSHWQNNAGGYTTNDYNFGQSLTFFASQGYPNNTLYERFWKQYIQETYSENSREVLFNTIMPIEEVDDLSMNENVYFNGVKFRIVEMNNVSLGEASTFPIKMMKRIAIENIDRAPFWPYDVLIGVVQWNSSLDNSDLGDGSASDQTDLEASALAYGFAYDANLDIAVQRGIILSI